MSVLTIYVYHSLSNKSYKLSKSFNENLKFQNKYFISKKTYFDKLCNFFYKKNN